jgi:hypothetical protein
MQRSAGILFATARSRAVRGGLRAISLLGLAVASAGCQTMLRVRGSEPRDPRPTLEEVALPEREYRVAVIVPSLVVHTYPLPDKTQQPLLQFTGDRERYEKGLGEMTMLVSPDQFHDGDRVDYFGSRVLWKDQISEDDTRDFALFLRENNRSAPTRIDAELEKLAKLAEIIEEITGATGFKIPAAQAMTVTTQVLKAVQKDWLILKWSCPWRYVAVAARRSLAKLAAGQPGEPKRTLLRARIVASEEAGGRPAAELEVLFYLEELVRPLPAAAR